MSVFIGSIPNNTEDDLKTAKDLLKKPSISKGKRKNLQEKFEKDFPKHSIFLFNKGREAFYFLFKNIPLVEDDEVIVQAFTCVAVVAPILWAKAKPIYVDIDKETFNMDLEKLKNAITEKTKVIIVQHTFGNLVKMDRVREIVNEVNRDRSKERKIMIIEDCAHLYTPDKNIGSFSDVLLFSFAQDKAISCTQGAMLAVKKYVVFKEILLKEYKKVPDITSNDALYNARYISYWTLIKKYYFTLNITQIHFSLGKFLLVLFRTLGLIKKQASVNSLQYDGIYKLSNIQAHLLLPQISRAIHTNSHRKQIYNLYSHGLKEDFRFHADDSSVLRYPVLLSNPIRIKEELKMNQIIVGRWYTSPIFPIEWSKLPSVGYKTGTCPVAEFCCKNIVNLPTNNEVTDEIARHIVWIVNSLGKQI